MERIDDLQFDGLKIIQNDDYFCFGIDSVLLANFAKNDIKKNSVIADLGAGTGVLSLLLAKKANPKKVVEFEVQKEVYDIAVRNIELNKLDDKIEARNIDIKDVDELSKYDVVITNPPYKKLGTGINSDNKVKQISRFESTATTEDFIKIASKMLKSKGQFYMVNRVDRLTEIMQIMWKNHLEIKTMRFVHSKVDVQSTMVLIKAVKEGNTFMKIDKPLIIYDENGEYTDEIKNI